MELEEVPVSAEQRPCFPFEILWPGYGNADVQLKELLEQAEEYRIFAKVSAQTREGLRFVLEDDVAQVLNRHGVSEDHARSFWVITCFYLYPRHVEAFGIDPKKSRETLNRAAHQATMLARQLRRLSPKVYAALAIMRPVLEDAINPEGEPFHALLNEVDDFALTARAAASDLAAAEGRPREHHRDTMFRLLIELTQQVGLDDLAISNGTKARPDPHLKGAAGMLILEIIHLVEPSWAEAWIALRIKLVRAKMRRRNQLGAKTEQT